MGEANRRFDFLVRNALDLLGDEVTIERLIRKVEQDWPKAPESKIRNSLKRLGVEVEK